MANDNISSTQATFPRRHDHRRELILADLHAGRVTFSVILGSGIRGVPDLCQADAQGIASQDCIALLVTAKSFEVCKPFRLHILLRFESYRRHQIYRFYFQ